MMALMNCHPFLHSVLTQRRQTVQRLPRANRHSGFSLVEVLVSIVVLSFGLLGMVGMQAASLQANREARYQSEAMFFARELAEMIRGDKVEGVKPTATNPYIGTFSFPLTPVTASYCMSVATGTTACTGTTDIANAEMTDWLARVNYELPSANVVICYDDTPFNANGLPQWACTGAGSTSGIIVIKIGWTRGSTNRSNTSAAAALERATVPSVILPVTP
jgi:type IV pilus assembly protein PilV